MSQNGWRQLAEFLVSAEPVKNGCATDDGMNSDGNADPAVLEGNGGADKKTQGEDGTEPLRNEIKPENIHADADDCIVEEDDDDEEGAVIIVQDEDSEIPKDANALVVRVKEPPGKYKLRRSCCFELSPTHIITGFFLLLQESQKILIPSH